MLAKVAQWRRGTGSYEHFFLILVIIGNVPLFLPAGYFCCNFINHNRRVGKGIKGGSGPSYFCNNPNKYVFNILRTHFDLCMPRWHNAGVGPGVMSTFSLF